MSFRAAALAVLLACGSANAADGGWEHTAIVYGIGASIDGKAGVGNVTADVDVGFDDILDNLEFGAMAAYRADRGDWAVVADLIFMSLEQKKGDLGPLGGTRATAESDLLILELDGSYGITERLDVYGGLRYWNLDADIDVVGGGPFGQTLSASKTEDWVDPLVGLRSQGTPRGPGSHISPRGWAPGMVTIVDIVKKHIHDKTFIQLATEIWGVNKTLFADDFIFKTAEDNALWSLTIANQEYT